jgi:hypothetical protein
MELGAKRNATNANAAATEQSCLFSLNHIVNISLMRLDVPRIVSGLESPVNRNETKGKTMMGKMLV